MDRRQGFHPRRTVPTSLGKQLRTGIAAAESIVSGLGRLYGHVDKIDRAMRRIQPSPSPEGAGRHRSQRRGLTCTSV
jgi:hypothetical protein